MLDKKKKGNVWRKIEKKTKKVVQGEQPRQGSHCSGYKRDKLSRFFLPLQLPHGREYKQVFPGEFSRLVHTAPIENLRQFRRASMYPRETSSGRARRRESCGKMQEKGVREGRVGKEEKYRRDVALVAAQFRVKMLSGGRYTRLLCRENANACVVCQKCECDFALW